MSSAPDAQDSPATSAGHAAEGAPPSLWRNRNFNILWISLLCSMLSSEIVFVAFPLLIIANGEPVVLIGLVSATLAVTHMAANIPAGVIADRWSRKNLMLLAQGVRALAAGGLAVALITDTAYLVPWMLLAAVAEGMFSSVFEPAEHAVLPQVVDRTQLATAIARNSARPFVALLLGPALAGFAFVLNPHAPFLLVAGMLTISFFAIMLLRLPAAAARGGTRQAVPGDAPAEPSARNGFRWILGHRYIRATVIWMVFINLAFNALVIIIIAVSGESGVAAGNIGLMMACLGAGGILGAILAERLSKLFRASIILIGATWVLALMAAVMTVVPAGIPLGLALGAAAMFAPVANSTVMTYHLSVAPAELRGRLGGIVGFCSDGAGVLGPLAGGFLVAAAGEGSMSIAVCAAALIVIATVTTLSRAMRTFPTVGVPVPAQQAEPRQA